MARYRCNSCGAEYSDSDSRGVPYFHACPTEKITHATFAKDGTQLTPEKREPFPNRRDENVPENLVYVEGKPYLQTRDQHDVTRINREPAVSLVKSEGAGRTLLEDAVAAPRSDL